ncbi:hypothetical protein QVD17_27581 [Tagetes erecta]|uniref:TIR domain-containing protein n=1 Tax=Tagetes erecta TaxID=13708 RepID=A0AAD8KC76_TARER|nr:hypothetical protein QVD17_27581 [Tagetes erecta]
MNLNTKITVGSPMLRLMTVSCAGLSPSFHSIISGEGDFSSSINAIHDHVNIYTWTFRSSFTTTSILPVTDPISMASTSSSAIIASSSNDDACSYDVFLSFRGEDTRHSFTDHLYHRLIQAGICTFRDEEDINRGEELKPEIERAIKASRASIVVLSQNYATSTWCLDELLLILQQRRECGHIVLPVFYGVEPTYVRNQKGSFDIQVKPSSRWTDHSVNQWKMALMEVADLIGLELSGYGSMSNLILV